MKRNDSADIKTGILATDFTLHKFNTNGDLMCIIILDGTERIGAICAQCDKPFHLEIGDFCKLISNGFDFYSTSVICGSCTRKMTLTGGLSDANQASYSQ
ncbi:MAG: hypothetical protein FWC75_06330 [Oscillospiraceae bacterium]|nr:hypothetical protein [Oscillospiraceae bacterium]